MGVRSKLTAKGQFLFISASMALTLGIACTSDDASSKLDSTSQALTAESWEEGKQYQVGDLVLFESKTWRCISAHTAHVGAGWTPVASPSLWEEFFTEHELPGGPATSFLSLNPTLEELIFEHRCESNPSNCCPAGATPNVLTDQADTAQLMTPGECVIASHGADTLMVHAEGPQALHLGPGDDTAFAGVGHSVVFGNSGRDTLFSNQGGNHVLFGGAGDDNISSLAGNVRAVPGPGADTVALGGGDDTVYIFDVCEVESGETISGGAGHDTLVIPLPLEELQALGLNVSGFEEVRIEPRSCYSECVRSDSQPGTSEFEVDGSAFDQNISCPEASDFRDGTARVDCFRGTDEADFGSLAATQSGVREFLFSGPGNDVLVAQSSDAQVISGEGDDVLCAMGATRGGLFGGPGNDKLQSSSELARILPGAGVDDVLISGGSANIYINHACEVEPGDRVRVLGGKATIHAPLTAEELAEAGLQMEGQVEYKLTEPHSCFSSCSGAPVCDQNAECHDTAQGPTCLPRDPSLTDVEIPVTNRYPSLSETDSKILTWFVEEIRVKGYRGVAPTWVRQRAPQFEKALISAINQQSILYRASEIFALGALYTNSALHALGPIALQSAPPSISAHPHFVDGAWWYEGQFEAVRWLLMAAQNLENQDEWEAYLLDISSHPDLQTAEIALDAVRFLHPGSTGEALLRQKLGTQHSLFELSFN